MANSVITMDGSVLEGGGQILRNAAALSCITRQPLKVINVRAGRSKPGLRPQHLSGLELICQLCGGQLEGGHIGSTEVTLYPADIGHGNFLADTKTAGSVCLLLQAALPCLLYGSGPSKLTLKGGTNADMAPQIDYFTWVMGPISKKFGVNFHCNIKRRGYFPKGGGEVEVDVIAQCHLEAVELVDAGKVVSINGRAFVAGVLPLKIANTMARVVKDILKKEYRDIPINIEAVKEENAFGNGTGIIVMAETSTGCRLAGSALGKRGVPAEAVGQEAADNLLNSLQYGACVDEYLQDQLIILMALAKGTSKICSGPLTLHTKTAIHVAESLTKAKFQVTENGDKVTIVCEGAGITNEHKQT